MASSRIAKTMLSAREASAAMAMVTARTEKNNWHAVGFTCGVPGEYRHPKLQGPHAGGGYYRRDQYISSLTPLDISPRRRLDDIVQEIGKLPLGGTDCALPIMYALDKGMAFDTFVVYTDNETWAGEIHPHEALRLYRQRTGINAKLIVVGMTATEFSIANPTDPGMLDVVGFDTYAPAIMADFAKN
jgi:60 kDa SS-A/Ro ribonucleoprotein